MIPYLDTSYSYAFLFHDQLDHIHVTNRSIHCDTKSSFALPGISHINPLSPFLGSKETILEGHIFNNIFYVYDIKDIKGVTQNHNFEIRHHIAKKVVKDLFNQCKNIQILKMYHQMKLDTVIELKRTMNLKGSFLLMCKNNEKNLIHLEEEQGQSVPVQVPASSEKHKKFSLHKTNYTDVFVIKDHEQSLIARVPTLKISKEIQSKNPKYVYCSYNTRFKKWDILQCC